MALLFALLELFLRFLLTLLEKVIRLKKNLLKKEASGGEPHLDSTGTHRPCVPGRYFLYALEVIGAAFPYAARP